MVFMPDSDVYTALERGVIDAQFDVLDDMFPYEYYQVAPYYLDEPIMSQNMSIIINLDLWNGLPQHLQDLLTEVQLELLPVWFEDTVSINEEMEQAMLDAGVTFINFSPEDAEWWIETASNMEWDRVIEKSPELGPKFKELLTP